METSDVKLGTVIYLGRTENTNFVYESRVHCNVFENGIVARRPLLDKNLLLDLPRNTSHFDNYLIFTREMQLKLLRWYVWGTH